MTIATPPLERSDVQDDRVEILIHQFYVAANLYLHEDQLAEYGGGAVTHLPAHLQVIHSRFARVSPTVWVLRLFPVVLGLVWAGLVIGIVA